jgi:hypothetical protein
MPEPTLTAADHQELWRVTAELFPDHPENAELAPWQMLRVLERVGRPTAERMVTHWRDRSDAALDCFIRNHEQQIDHWRARALAAEGQLRARDAHPAGRGPCPVCEQPVALPLLAGHLLLHERRDTPHQHTYEQVHDEQPRRCTFCASPEPEETSGA